MTAADPFTDRLARVRDRFAAALTGKIEDACAALPRLADGAPAAASLVEETYRSIHGMVGVAPTVGFPATGQAAHQVEDILRPSQQAKRGLTADEISLLMKTLQMLREAATSELGSPRP